VAHPRHPVTGRQLRVSAPTPAALARILEVLDTYRRELRAGARSREDVSQALARIARDRVTLEAAARAYAARPELSRHTRRHVLSWLRGPAAPLAGIELEALRAPRLALWLEGLERAGAAPSSRGLAWRILRAVVRHAAEHGQIDASPWGAWRPAPRLVTGPRRREAREACRSLAELERLEAAALCISRDLHARVVLLGRLGLRSGELARLAWSDVDGGSILVRASKGRGPVRLELPEVVRQVIEDHRAWLEVLELRTDRGPVFPALRLSSPGRPAFASRGLEARQLRAAVAAAGLPRPGLWSPHSLRDSFAILTAQACGGDLAALMAATRHASIASLARYLRPMRRDEGPPALPPAQAPADPSRAPPSTLNGRAAGSKRIDR
jgi:integrase